MAYILKDINFLGLPLVRFSEQDINNFSEKYVDILPKSLFSEVMESIYQKVKNKYNLVFIVRVNAVGESYLLNYLYKEIAEKLQTENYCFLVCNNSHYENIFKIFSDTPFISVDIDRKLFNDALTKRKFTYKGIIFYVHQSTVSELNNLFRIKYAKENYQVSYPDWILNMSLAEKYTYSPMVISQKDKDIVNRLVNINLNNFVFLSTKAKSVLPIADSFWNLLKYKICKKGYDIFENNNQFTFSQVVYIASLSRHIISLRSGLDELLSTLDVPKHILYTKHMFSPISVQKTKEVHSLLNYPFVNKNTIFEYEFNNNQDKIIDKIMQRI